MAAERGGTFTLLNAKRPDPLCNQVDHSRLTLYQPLDNQDARAAHGGHHYDRRASEPDRPQEQSSTPSNPPQAPEPPRFMNTADPNSDGLAFALSWRQFEAGRVRAHGVINQTIPARSLPDHVWIDLRRWLLDEE